MANKNPDRPTENVPLGGQPTPIAVPADQPPRETAAQQGRNALSRLIAALEREAQSFKRVPGNDMIDNAWGAIQFCKQHLEMARTHLKE